MKKPEQARRDGTALPLAALTLSLAAIFGVMAGESAHCYRDLSAHADAQVETMTRVFASGSGNKLTGASDARLAVNVEEGAALFGAGVSGTMAAGLGLIALSLARSGLRRPAP